VKNKIKIGLVCFAIIVLQQFTMAQETELNATTKEKIEAEKVAFITKKMDLTPTESQAFWPVYNQYRKELETTRQDKKDLLHDAKKKYETMTDAEIEKAIQESFLMEQHELDLKKKYFFEFKKIITSKKIAKLYRAERLWTLQLVQRLKELQQDR
jgi:hypothetical protein